MTASSNGNLSRVTGSLCGEFTGKRWIPRTKVSDAELLYFLWSTTWINGWINNREAGDSTRHRAHYVVLLMCVARGFLKPHTNINIPLDQIKGLILKRWMIRFNIHAVSTPAYSAIANSNQSYPLPKFSPYYIYVGSGLSRVNRANMAGCLGFLRRHIYIYVSVMIRILIYIYQISFFLRLIPFLQHFITYISIVIL